MRIATDTKFTAYNATSAEADLLGKDGKCSSCGMFAPAGYLVPSTDAYLCPVCYSNLLRSRYRAADEMQEDIMARHYESVVAVEGGHEE